MPLNATVEYYKAEEKYKSAKTKEEKIKYLEEMIRELPKHKGAENVLAQLRRRLAKLKSQKETKKGSKQFTIKKEGAGQVCIIGLPNSGKSVLLKALTNVDVDIDTYPFTTVKPEMGMAQYEDVWIQIIEIPSTFTGDAIGILHGCDIIIMLLDGEKNLDDQRKELQKILDEHNIKKKIIEVVSKKPIDLDNLKKQLWKNLNLIRVYTKAPREKPVKKPIITKQNSTIEDVVREVHQDFLKHFKYAKVWGDSVKVKGTKVGLDHRLKDKDIIEIHS
ncbi:MAG: TGS domain-containing protein [Candidatus Aenigmarchaeota archaeon]|nr:TGS domain-containing protein [Candidatus Aenigmarchaeota archaeon]